ncbi:MAG: hypothetical protein WBX22_00265, partial [Silvibacterium sp.]
DNQLSGAFSSRNSVSSTRKAVYIRADQHAIPIFRLQYGGGPYIRNAGNTAATKNLPAQSAIRSFQQEADVSRLRILSAEVE